jgi:hypothetical protein
MPSGTNSAQSILADLVHVHLATIGGYMPKPRNKNTGGGRYSRKAGAAKKQEFTVLLFLVTSALETLSKKLPDAVKIQAASDCEGLIDALALAIHSAGRNVDVILGVIERYVEEQGYRRLNACKTQWGGKGAHKPQISAVLSAAQKLLTSRVSPGVIAKVGRLKKPAKPSKGAGDRPGQAAHA